MITPAEIATKALRKYPQYLSTLVTGEPFFPLEIRFGTRTPKGNFHEFDRLRSQLMNGAKSPRRPGYTVELTTQAMRRYGEQAIPTRITCETEADYLSVIDKTQEVAQFKCMVHDFQASLPGCTAWLADHAKNMVPYLSVYLDLIKVCLYFKEHPRPGCYIRELPIEVHTKFIENHTRILRPLLDAILPESAIDPKETLFTARFGLKASQPLIRFRLLSTRAKRILQGTYHELALPTSHFKTLNFNGLTVIIVENLMTYLTWPSDCGDMVVFGKGFQADIIQHNQSLHHATLWYWGDLDAQGFMILSRLRSHLPHAQSFLMDQETYQAHNHYAVKGTPNSAVSLPGLSRQETDLFVMLRDSNRRLEQEHIPLAYIKSRFKKLV